MQMAYFKHEIKYFMHTEKIKVLHWLCWGMSCRHLSLPLYLLKGAILAPNRPDLVLSPPPPTALTAQSFWSNPRPNLHNTSVPKPPSALKMEVACVSR